MRKIITPTSKESKSTKQSLIIQELKKLKKINSSFDKKAFVKEHWGNNEYFTVRSFDVMFSHAKKKLPGKNFRSIGGFITRIL